VFVQTEEGVVLNSAVRQLNQITTENAASFHIHGDEARLPLNAVLFFPATPKDSTITKARINASPTTQMLVPTRVIDDLLGFVFRIKGFLDLVAVTLAACVSMMTVLVVLLTMRLRAAEMRTFEQIGCGRFTVCGLYATELGMIALTSLVLAGTAVAVTLVLLPDLVTAL